MKTYTKEEARKFLIGYQNLDGREDLVGPSGTKAIMERIGSIQYDPLNVVGRNADLTLQARVRDYKAEYLQTLLYEERCLVDGYDKEMCIYHAKDFHLFSKVREEQAKSVIATLAYRNQLDALNIIEDVKAFIAQHGKTGTKDISIGEVREGTWGHRKLSSAALDYLYSKGELCVVEKKGTQKYFDFAEKYMPKSDTSNFDEMSLEDFLDWYVERRIRCVGFIWNKRGGAWLGNYLSQNDLRGPALHRLVEKNRLEIFGIEGIRSEFYGIKNMEQYLDQDNHQDFARFIAPLDNIMWDRKMLEELFNFKYTWEVYLPESKRKYGYYLLPVLYGDRFVARFEAEPVSRAGSFVIKNWWWEPEIEKSHR